MKYLQWLLLALCGFFAQQAGAQAPEGLRSLGKNVDRVEQTVDQSIQFTRSNLFRKSSGIATTWLDL
ncbi:hypothetical protein [Massilia agri]|uniref:Uncharacterized protein n=1 Tax=Massilia agri TaxID=1886785 RepID=A0ABT2AP52_9BURK|nr:hypothetical protein [Massilia agri]MCS0598007.1 hypothetical protein [Massilia agri]